MSNENTGTTPDPAADDRERMASLENQIRELSDRLASLASRREAPPFSNPPVGTVVAYAGEVDANFEELQGWLLCDGRPLSAAGTYQYLSLALGTTYGDGRDEGGNQVGDFNLPDYRGYFLRGVDPSGRVDPGSVIPNGDRVKPGGGATPYIKVGSLQKDDHASHGHGISDPGHGHDIIDPGHAHPMDWNTNATPGGSAHERSSGLRDPGRPVTLSSKTNITVKEGTSKITIKEAGGRETRPKNVSVNWIIKYRLS